MTVKERLSALRKCMKDKNIDYYLVPSEDYHGSEYVGDYFKGRAYLSGFTGSAGTLLVGQKEAGLWTDGRYFLQAEEQLAGSGIALFKQGQTDVPDIYEYLEQIIEKEEKLGMDFRCISASQAERFHEITAKKQACLLDSGDLLQGLWRDRPLLSSEKAYRLPKKYAGVPAEDKLAQLRGKMCEKDAELMVISALDEICWLLNLRGNDIQYAPMVLSYLIIGKDEGYLFVQEKAVTEELKVYLKKIGIQIRCYSTFYQELGKIAAGKKVWADQKHNNGAIFAALLEAKEIVKNPSPVILEKAMKNSTELDGFRKAHLLDGIAVTRFMYWLKTKADLSSLSEISVSDKQEEFRCINREYQMPSFEPISAYGPHGAVIHYSPDQASDASLKAEGFLLMDTGGHYNSGSTDITRTYALGPLSMEQKKYYTRVLQGNLRLAATVFPKGCTGETFDIVAREPLWQELKDYRHGTGHGVGHILNIHEGPQSFRFKHVKGTQSAAFAPGMVISNEPGYYEDGRFGVRLENLMVCVPKGSGVYGTFYGWETLTLVPFDLDAVDKDLLSDTDKELLNVYHKQVCEKITPYLANEDERRWLLTATRRI